MNPGVGTCPTSGFRRLSGQYINRMTTMKIREEWQSDRVKAIAITLEKM
jgi:hypothetical protein